MIFYNLSIIIIISNMQYQVPPQLQYSQLQRKAFFSVYKSWPIQPIANSGQYYPGQVIRIFLNALTDGVMDPYRSHIQLTVSCDQATLPVGLLQVDNSAQSFIQQLVIQSKNRQIQRIIQYGCLAAYLTDVGISQIYSQGKQTQGLGFSNVDTYSGLYSSVRGAPSPTVFKKIGDFGKNLQPKFVPCNGTIFPTIPYRTQSMSDIQDQNLSFTQLVGAARGHVNWINPAWNPTPQSIWWYQAIGQTGQCKDDNLVTSVNYYGYANNIRAQYLNAMSSNKYIDSSSSFSNYQVRLNADVYNGKYPGKFDRNTVYRVYVPPFINYYQDPFTDGGGQRVRVIQPILNTVNTFGYTNLYGPAFSKGVNEPFISPTVPQCQLYNGRISPSKKTILRRTFKIPIISCILGVLIPQSQFVLIPLRALNDCIIQLTIDPAAMFTSGYNDISQYDDKGMVNQQIRAFTVQRVIYNLHTYQFYSPEMDQYLKININSGIAINTHLWQLGNQYQIQNSQSIGNSWQVACNQEALNQILIIFVPMDFQNFSYCRKHFRISNNIERMQFRINMQYYPSQPLSGNAGNPVQIDSSGDNSIFLEQIYQSNGYFFTRQQPMPRINAYNFALNQRPYNIFNTNPMYDSAMAKQRDYHWNQHSINSDTSMGMSHIHQNRCVGKAAFLFSFQPYSHSKDLLTGVDCRKAKQFDVIFGVGVQNPFPRPQMMLIYTRSSNIIQYGRQGISVIRS